jgi:hypothetical protein
MYAKTTDGLTCTTDKIHAWRAGSTHGRKVAKQLREEALSPATPLLQTQTSPPRSASMPDAQMVVSSSAEASDATKLADSTTLLLITNCLLMSFVFFGLRNMP